MTGRSVSDAAKPGSAAERPAPQISTRQPRAFAPLHELAGALGSAVRRGGVEFVAHAGLGEDLEGRLDAGLVALGADEDQDVRHALQPSAIS